MTRNDTQESCTAIPIFSLRACPYNYYRYDLYRQLSSTAGGKLPAA